MSQTLALSEAKRLQKIVQRYGVKCTIELKAGRPWSGSAWYSEKEVLMNHHTAGPSSGLTPSYAVCRNGRPGVPGPLCNGYGGRDLVFRIVTMGLANHPGAGGPLTVAGVTMPKDSARIASFGIEWEHNGVSDWPPAMMEFMGRVGAAVLEWMGRPLLASIEHKTWAPSRKIDRNDFTHSGSTGQALIKKYQGTTTPPKDDDDMTPAEMTAWAKSPEGKQALMNANAGAWGGPTIPDRLHAHLDSYFVDRLNPSRQGGVHRVLTWFRVAPWHQLLGKGPANMHQVMGELRAAATVIGSLPDLIAEAGDEVGLTPEQIQQMADSVAAKVDRVTVIVEDPAGS